jgi:reverse transcriptase-like protein
MPADTLSSDSLDWALTHISRFGDTDIFPVPFEFDALKHGWSWIKAELEKIDLADYGTRGTRRMLVPKPGAGFRVVTQLDPIDALIYAAISYETAPDVENNRIPRDRRIACSYRVDIDPKGRLFAPQSGLAEYHDHSKYLADTGQYSHVLIADIADFYNQIYSHRVESALETANVPQVRARNVERFLLSLTAKQSRGAPVGPSVSILLAEAVLTDVDNFLLRLGVPFTRFVDDFRIFCMCEPI